MEVEPSRWARGEFHVSSSLHHRANTASAFLASIRQYRRHESRTTSHIDYPEDRSATGRATTFLHSAAVQLVPHRCSRLQRTICPQQLASYNTLDTTLRSSHETAISLAPEPVGHLRRWPLKTRLPVGTKKGGNTICSNSYPCCTTDVRIPSQSCQYVGEVAEVSSASNPNRNRGRNRSVESAASTALELLLKQYHPLHIFRSRMLKYTAGRETLGALCLPCRVSFARSTGHLLN